MKSQWWIKAESYKRGTLFSVLYNILSKGILFLLTIIIARYFGSNIKTDIYFFVFGAMLLFSGFINNIDAAVLIPESMRLREKNGDAAAMSFLNFFLWVYLSIGILFTAAMYLFGTKVYGLISRFSEEDILAYRNYFLTGSLFFIFHLLTNYINTILTSLRYFSVPMLVSSIKSAIAIICIFLLKGGYDVLSVFWGGLISYAFNLFFLLLILHRSAGWKFNFQLQRIGKKTGNNIFYASLGQAATLASSLFPLYLLSGFGSGVISVMNYGKNIADIPNTLVTTQIASVSGIKLNEEAARHNAAAMNDTFVSTSKMLVFILVPMGFFLFAFARPIVEFFYQSRHFTAGSITDAAVFLQLLAITLFSTGINAMVTRIFIAVQAIRQAFVYQVMLNILLIIVIWLCTRFYDAYGYPLGIIIINVVNYAGMYFICKKIAPAIDYMVVLKYSGLMILVNAFIAAALYFAMDFFPFGVVAKLLFGFLAYLLILLALNRRFHFNAGLGQFINHVAKRFF